MRCKCTTAMLCAAVRVEKQRAAHRLPSVAAHLSVQEGRTPLIFSAFEGATACVEMLIAAGAALNAEDEVRLRTRALSPR